LERQVAAGESERRIASQHAATRETELITANTELASARDALESQLHKEKSDNGRFYRSIDELQNELNSKNASYEKLQASYREQVTIAEAATEEMMQIRRAHSELRQNHEVDKEQLQHKISMLQQAEATLHTRIASLEDSLISTSNELKKSTELLEAAQQQLHEEHSQKASLSASHSETQASAQAMARQLAAHTEDVSALTQRVAELTHSVAEQREVIADHAAKYEKLERTHVAATRDLEAAKASLQGAEDGLRDVRRQLEAAEDKVHYLQNIAIPDVNNSATVTVERVKSEQVMSSFLVELLTERFFYLHILACL
jgi:chromosome segregation ATPase